MLPIREANNSKVRGTCGSVAMRWERIDTGLLSHAIALAVYEGVLRLRLEDDGHALGEGYSAVGT
jgi:hypothetical protein